MNKLVYKGYNCIYASDNYYVYHVPCNSIIASKYPKYLTTKDVADDMFKETRSGRLFSITDCLMVVFKNKWSPELDYGNSKKVSNYREFGDLVESYNSIVKLDADKDTKFIDYILGYIYENTVGSEIGHLIVPVDSFIKEIIDRLIESNPEYLDFYWSSYFSDFLSRRFNLKGKELNNALEFFKKCYASKIRTYLYTNFDLAVEFYLLKASRVGKIEIRDIELYNSRILRDVLKYLMNSVSVEYTGNEILFRYPDIGYIGSILNDTNCFITLSSSFNLIYDTDCSLKLDLDSVTKGDSFLTARVIYFLICQNDWSSEKIRHLRYRYDFLESMERDEVVQRLSKMDAEFSKLYLFDTEYASSMDEVIDRLEHWYNSEVKYDSSIRSILSVYSMFNMDIDIFLMSSYLLRFLQVSSDEFMHNEGLLKCSYLAIYGDLRSFSDSRVFLTKECIERNLKFIYTENLIIPMLVKYGDLYHASPSEICFDRCSYTFDEKTGFLDLYYDMSGLIMED